MSGTLRTQVALKKIQLSQISRKELELLDLCYAFRHSLQFKSVTTGAQIVFRGH